MAAQQTDTAAGAKAHRARRFRSKQERRQIVEETLKPGASISRVARAHDVNTNQLFKWRREFAKDDWKSRRLPPRTAHYFL
jgi:transposase